MEMKVDQNNVKKDLLLVEDERVIGSTCSRILTKEGFNVVLATNGEWRLTVRKSIDSTFVFYSIQNAGYRWTSALQPYFVARSPAFHPK